MAFTPKEWHDGSEGGTPITAAALGDMETRLSDYADSLGGGGGGGGAGARAYVDAVQRVPGLALYLPFTDDETAIVGEDATLIGGAQIDAAVGLPPGLGTNCAIFDGTNDMATVPLDVGTNAITLFTWARIPTNADSDNIIAELGAAHASAPNSFMIDLVSGGTFYLVSRGHTGTFTPTGEAVPPDKRAYDGWHPLAFVFDRGYTSTSDGHRVEFFFDAEKLIGQTNAGAGTQNFPAATLNIGGQDGGGLYANVNLAHFAIFDRRLYAHEVHYLSQAHLFAPEVTP